MLDILNLEVVYHSVVRVLHGVSLSVGDGEIVALLGPNGAGKTTTLRAVTGLLPLHEGRITKGQVRLQGASIAAQSAERIVGGGVAQVMEGRRILAELSVEDNLVAGAYSSTREFIRKDLERYYTKFPILAERRHQPAGYLSGGEQQMLAIARALMSRPKLLLLDEPSLGLAPKIVAEVAGLIRTIRDEEGVSILVVEQNAHVALELADRGYLLEHGRVVLDGTAAELKNDSDVQEFYLGVGSDSTANYRDVKRYRRRKRWLS
ncbi:MAG: ABC transporter ATP-binding protein [Myxococcota bacterium]|nr:ABC transporter ATP-binding protein [Myxococcota bacterium]